MMSNKNKIVAFKNKDKSFAEKWSDGKQPRDWLNIPWAYRGVLTGPPNSGKSTIVKNLVMKARPYYTKVMVVHYAMDEEGDGCDDYAEFEDDEGFSVVPLSSLPDPRKINPKKEKFMLILEDIPMAHLTKIEKQKLDRLYGYSSSHRGVTVLTCAQNSFDVPVGARRCSNLFILWAQPDLMALALMAGRTGYKVEDFRKLFKLCKGRHDSIWIDLTENSPAPLRLNGYELIDLKSLPD